MPGSGPVRLELSGKRLPLSRTIVRFLIQVKPATGANSNSKARMLQRENSVILWAAADIRLGPRNRDL